MKTSKEYGDQLDISDGTIGKLQLVKRWFSGGIRQGRFTYENKPEWNYEDGSKWELWYCYPRHFDPICKVPNHTQ